MRDFKKIREIWTSLSNASTSLKGLERDYTRRISETVPLNKIK